MRTSLGRVVTPSALLLVVSTLAACAHAPGVRNESADADLRLAGALAEIDRAHLGGQNTGAVMEHEPVVVDSGSARTRLEQCALEFPRHVPTLVMCAQSSFDAGEREKAAAYADRALALQPDNNFAAIIRARAALGDGNVPKARDLLRKQLVTTPDSCYLHETLAGVEFYAGDLEASEREIALAERYGADAWRVSFHRGLLCEKRGNAAEAKKHYEKSSQLCPAAEAPKTRINGVSPPAGQK